MTLRDLMGTPRRAHSVPNECRRLWNGIVRPSRVVDALRPAGSGGNRWASGIASASPAYSPRRARPPARSRRGC